MNRSTIARLAWALCLGVGALVACTSTTPPPPEPTDPPVTSMVTAAANTTATSTTTEGVAATSTTATTSTPAPTTSSAQLATTTEAPATVEPADAAVAAFLAGKSAAVECYSQLPTCDPTPLAEYFADPQLKRLVDEVQALNSRGVAYRNLGAYKTFVTGTTATDDQHVEVAFCAEDGIVQVVPSATGDSIVDDAFLSSVGGALMVVDGDGKWKLVGYNQYQQASGQENSLCGGG